MQLLSALDQMTEALWLAIYAAAFFVVFGMAVHATIPLARRLRVTRFNRSDFRAWARRTGKTLRP